ncbi:MAG: ATP-dependent helicase [Anaerolineaceae bacterium]
MLEPHLRASQQAILEYTGGKMGISAVPGSGKTWTLSRLAANLILKTELKEDQEILVVTFSNTAADNFTARIGTFLKEYGVLPGLGYRVRTLHGLAVDILRMRPELAGLSEDFSIIDENQTDEIFDEVIARWLSSHNDELDELFVPNLTKETRQKNISDLLKRIAMAFIRTAKDLHLSPENISQLVENETERSVLFDFSLELYQQYQARLAYLGGVDFNDMMRLAYQTLKLDPALVSQLAHKWPFILEDEAQDSSEMQQEILSLLTSQTGNWVRVGDPNQSINESFTTSKPDLLKDFITQKDVKAMDLPESGRSAPAIIDLANTLNRWVQKHHPNLYARDALTDPLIEPTKPGDPQKNPNNSADTVVIIDRAFTPEQELGYIAHDAARWIKANPEKTVAILAFTNNHINKFVKAIKQEGLEPIDTLLRIPKSTQDTAGTITHVLNHLNNPANAKLLGRAFRAYFRDEYKDEGNKDAIDELKRLIDHLDFPEEFLFPHPDENWLGVFGGRDFTDTEIDRLSKFRNVVNQWHAAATLPFDQCILTVALDLPMEANEIAVVYHIASFVKDLAENNPSYDRSALTEEIEKISKSERDFAKSRETDEGFDPSAYKGSVVLSTMHKAKGLEWDKVYLTSANNYDYPSGDETDEYISERWFVKSNRNLEAEAVESVYQLVRADDRTKPEPELVAYIARVGLIRERLRLLYVGITRSKEALHISWNKARGRSQQALPIRMLSEYLKEKSL